jgi:hypothetical protein
MISRGRAARRSLAGTDGPSSETRAWFGAIDDRGGVASSVVLDGEMSVDMVDVLAGHGGGERALLLGNVHRQGFVVSVDAHLDASVFDAIGTCRASFV